MTLFALDIGNKQTKMISEKGEKVYPSYYTMSDDVGESIVPFEDKMSVHKYEVKIDPGFEYAWGKEVSQIDTDNFLDTLNFNDRYKTREFQLLSSFALGELAKDFKEAQKDVLRVEVVTGVPTSDFNEENVKDIIKFLEGAHEITIDDVKYSILVKKVHVLPQPLGTIYDKMLDKNGKLADPSFKEDNVTICDIGGGTLLIDTMKKLKLDKKQRVQSKRGTHNLFDKIVEKVSNDKNIPGLTKYKVEEILRAPIDGKFYYKPNKNESYDITDVVAKSRVAFTREIINQLTGALKDTTSLDQVVFTGGGSSENIIDRKEVETRIKYSSFVDNAEFANAKGYFKYGKAVAKTESDEA
jgi:plasmid segregation protein ParM